MPKELARSIFMKRGRSRYPNEDQEVAIQHFMVIIDPKSHFDEQMRDFIDNHPEYSPWHLLFVMVGEVDVGNGEKGDG